MVKDLPYPYTSKAQFERSIDTPLGTEWNTRVGFQRGTLPKVVKKVLFILHASYQVVYSESSIDGHCHQSTGEAFLDLLHPSYESPSSAPYNTYGVAFGFC
jgi:hypothetical protein